MGTPNSDEDSAKSKGPPYSSSLRGAGHPKSACSVSLPRFSEDRKRFREIRVHI